MPTQGDPQSSPASPFSNTYFASPQVGTQDIGKLIMERVKRFESFVRRSGLFALWRKSYRAFHNMDDRGYTGFEVGRMGEQGELSVAKFNHFRSILTQAEAISTSTLGDMEPEGYNDDYASEIQVRKAKGILQYYDSESGLEDIRRRAIRYGYVTGTGAQLWRWSKSAGGALLPRSVDGLFGGAPGAPSGAPNPDSNQGNGQSGIDQTPTHENHPPPQSTEKPSDGVIYRGDLVSQAFHAINIIFDPRSRDDRHSWTILRDYAPKYDIAAEYASNNQELYDQVVRQTRMPTGNDSFYNLDMAMQLFYAPWDDETDEIPVFHFIHQPTPACPNGRYVVLLQANVVLLDVPLGQNIAGCKIFQPAALLDTAFGYTPAFDLLAPQEVIDTMSSIRVTNQRTFGVQCVVAPKGSDVSTEQISAGLSLIEYPPGMPEPKAMQLTATPPEIIKTRESDILEMGTIAGVSATSRGQASADQSGSALALVQAQDVQFSSDAQRRIRDFVASGGNILLEILQNNLDPAREYAILGTEGMLESVTVSGEDLKLVKRVVVKSGNPLAATISGRVQMAEILIQGNLVSNPKQLLRLLDTGRLEPVVRFDERQLALIKQENELLAKGIGPPPPQPQLPGQPPTPPPPGPYPYALITDDPRLHVKEHLTVLMTPAARQNPTVLQAVMGHVNQHLQLLTQATLGNMPMLELLGIEPLQSVLPPPPPPPGSPGSGVSPPEKPPGQGTPKKLSGLAGHGPPGGGEMPLLPAYPRNPASGDRFTPPQPAGANQ